MISPPRSVLRSLVRSFSPSGFFRRGRRNRGVVKVGLREQGAWNSTKARSGTNAESRWCTVLSTMCGMRLLIWTRHRVGSLRPIICPLLKLGRSQEPPDLCKFLLASHFIPYIFTHFSVCQWPFVLMKLGSQFLFKFSLQLEVTVLCVQDDSIPNWKKCCFQNLQVVVDNAVECRIRAKSFECLLLLRWARWSCSMHRWGASISVLLCVAFCFVSSFETWIAHDVEYVVPVPVPIRGYELVI